MIDQLYKSSWRYDRVDHIHLQMLDNLDKYRLIVGCHHWIVLCQQHRSTAYQVSETMFTLDCHFRMHGADIDSEI